jgi:hypothetical protein
MRAIRLQLKSGYRKDEPPEMLFLKRYPPADRGDAINFHHINKDNIPYMDLMKKAADRNPGHVERVYPAYAQHEPVGLTLVKKQYQYMQAGDDEATALRKAEEYVDALENKAYVELVNLRKILNDANAQRPFMEDPSVASELLKWQRKLRSTRYVDLDMAEQGEIDHMIHTKILKWNEVTRERRMKDPVFATQFRKLRKLILTSDPYEIEEMAAQKADKRDSEAMASVHADSDYLSMTASSPFYLEDYVRYYNMFHEQPITKTWKLQDKASVTNWLINCVATREMMEALEGEEVRPYLDMLKHQFFPMSFRPEKADTFEKLTVEGLRKVLYENEVGYRAEKNGKVWVRRYYKIPSLLFPVDAMAAQMLAHTDEVQ